MPITLQEIELKLSDDKFIHKISKNTGYDYLKLQRYILISLGEAKHTVELVNKYPIQDKAILEFGSGLGLASIMLYLQGYNITSFEPGGLGFEENNLVNQYIKQYFNLEFDLINDIDKIAPNSFYFIFSNNVLEHIDNIEETILKLDSYLEPKGIMLHNVPNYIIPYEPHFGIPFFPIFPRKMSFLISKKITNTSLWKSINFINVFDVKIYAKKAHATVKFDKQLIYKTIMRIEEDKKFAQRHQGISKIINIMKSMGILRILQILPVSLNTPMVFEWRKNID